MSTCGREADNQHEESAPVTLDTSWLNEPPAAEVGGGKRGHKRRSCRRKTLSPSQVTTSVSGVDWVNGDFTTYPDFPCLDDSVNITSAAGAGGKIAMPRKASLSPGAAGCGNSEEASEIWADKTDLACLTNDTPERRRTPLVRVLGPLDNQNDINEVASSLKDGANEEVMDSNDNIEPGQTAGNQKNAAPGTPDARVALEAENVQPHRTAPQARLSTGKAAAGASDVAASAVTASHSGNEAAKGEVAIAGEQRRPRKESRKSRRRSMVMPSEANKFINDRDGSTDVNAAGDPDSTAKDTDNTGSAGGSSSGKAHTVDTKLAKNSADSPAVITATSSLSCSMAVQRGWKGGPGDDTKTLVRAYYAAPRGSQRARRIAARLFCMTGYCLLPVAPDDARVLCAAAGDSLDWGLAESDVPVLRSQPCRRKTREQKRELVMRIKPLFDLIEQASKAEKIAVENATGIVSRKASPDGYCYEDRETGEAIDPAVYKAKYMNHVQSVSTARRCRFVLQRVDLQSHSKPEAGREGCSGHKSTSLENTDEEACKPGGNVLLRHQLSSNGVATKCDVADREGAGEEEEQISTAPTTPCSRAVKGGADETGITAKAGASPTTGHTAVVQARCENKNSTTVDTSVEAEGATSFVVQHLSVATNAEAETAPLTPTVNDNADVLPESATREARVIREIEGVATMLTDDDGTLVLSAGVSAHIVERSPSAAAGNRAYDVAMVESPASPSTTGVHLAQDTESTARLAEFEVVTHDSTTVDVTVDASIEDPQGSCALDGGAPGIKRGHATWTTTGDLNGSRNFPFASSLNARDIATALSQRLAKPEDQHQFGQGAAQVSGRVGNHRAASLADRELWMPTAETDLCCSSMPLATATAVSRPSGERGLGSILRTELTERAVNQHSENNPSLTPSSPAYTEPGVESRSPSVRGGSTPNVGANDFGAVGDEQECGTALWPLSVSPLSFPLSAERSAIFESAQADMQSENGGQVGFEATLGGSGAKAKSPPGAIRGTTRKFLVPDEYASVPREERAGLKAELDAIEERLHAAIDAAFQSYHAGRAFAIARRQRTTIPVATLPSSPPVADEQQALTSAASMPLATADRTADTPNTADPTARYEKQNENRMIDFARNPSRTEMTLEGSRTPSPGSSCAARDLPSVSPPEPKKLFSPPSGATQKVKTEFNGCSEDATVSCTPSSPLLPIPDLRLSEDDLFGCSSALVGDDGIDERSPDLAGEGDGSVVAGGVGKRGRISLWTAFSSTSQWRGGGSGSRRARDAKQRHLKLSQKERGDGELVGWGKNQGESPADVESAAEGSKGAGRKLGAHGAGGDGNVCQICCKRECDAVLRPCNHEACRACAKKLGEHAEQSAEALSCPWDRQLVSEIHIREN